MKLLVETNFDNINAKTDSEQKNMFIEGIFIQSEITNQNGRRYPKPLIDKEVARYIQEKINTKRSLGELNHPPEFNVNPMNASHLITELRESGTDYIGKAMVIKDNPCGAIVYNLIKSGVSLGVSTRGVGELNEEDGSTVEKYFMSTVDIVHDPSAPSAFVNGIMEQKEWVWDNGVIVESTLARVKHNLDTGKVKETTDKKPRSVAQLLHYIDTLSK